MKERHRQLKLPGLILAGSFLSLLLLGTLTSPVRDITYAAFFFLALMVFFFSLGYLAVLLQAGKVRPKAKYRIFIFSSLLLILIMFRSAQSLSWIDGLTLVLIALGLVFYTDRRAF